MLRDSATICDHKVRQQRTLKNCLSHVARQRNDMRKIPMTSFRHPLRCDRRDDRAMMTKKEPGEVNSRSRVSRLF